MPTAAVDQKIPGLTLAVAAIAADQVTTAGLNPVVVVPHMMAVEAVDPASKGSDHSCYKTAVNKGRALHNWDIRNSAASTTSIT